MKPVFSAHPVLNEPELLHAHIHPDSLLATECCCLKNLKDMMTIQKDNYQPLSALAIP